MGHSQRITAIAATDSGGFTATASEDGAIRLWKPPPLDREMAERVVELCGTVMVDVDRGNRRAKMRKVGELPLGDPRLSEVDLGHVKMLTDQDVDRLRALTALRALQLPEIDKPSPPCGDLNFRERRDRHA